MPDHRLSSIVTFLILTFACARGMAEEPLGKYLVSDDAAVRARAISEFQHLSVQEKQTLVPDLLMASDDEDPGVSKDASQLLEQMGVGARAPTEAMQKAVAQEQEAMDKPFGKNAASDLQTEKSPSYDDMRREIDQEKKSDFHELSRSEATPKNLLLDALKDPDPLIRSHAARELETIQPAPVEAIPTLVEMLRAKDAESRGAAAAALGAMGPAARPALPALLKSLGDADPGNREIVGEAVKQIQASAE